MIITSDKPYSKEETESLKEIFGTYIKTVIDLDKKVCSAGMDRHFEGEQILLERGSAQSNIWGGGIDADSKEIDFNSFINIRPNDDNPSNDIMDLERRKKYQELTLFFFRELYE